MWPPGYVTGNAFRQHKAAEAVGLGSDSPAEGGDAPKTKAETAERRGGVPPEESLITGGVGESAAEEADAPPDRSRSIHAGESGASAELNL